VNPAELFDTWVADFRALLAADAGLAWPPATDDGNDTGNGNAVPPVLMTLATVGPDGYPRTRNVMVSHTGAGRIWLHTDSRSEKARHLAANPRVSLTVLAADRSRQVTVIGDAVHSDPAEEAQAYADRSRYLQLLARLNDHRLAHQPEAVRHQRWADYAAAHPDLADDPPATWVGYAVVPREYLFWTADSEGPSQRRRFSRADGRWISEMIPG
jgi:pyridoxamine 5'-phosphate oxidase